MTQHTIPHTRPAPKRRPGDRDTSSRPVPMALVILSLIPVISGWAINAVVAEWVIRRPSVSRARRARAPLEASP
jgi:hypothetical protein